jgi:hypothetical protein
MYCNSAIFIPAENPSPPSVNYSNPKAWLSSNLILCNGFELRQNQEVIQEKKYKFCTETSNLTPLDMCLPI